MNPNKLFPIQAELDDRIVKKFGLEGKDLLPKKILALQVELAELANEARFFKFWSEDQEPRRNGERIIDNGIATEYRRPTPRRVCRRNTLCSITWK